MSQVKFYLTNKNILLMFEWNKKKRIIMQDIFGVFLPLFLQPSMVDRKCGYEIEFWNGTKKKKKGIDKNWLTQRMELLTNRNQFLLIDFFNFLQEKKTFSIYANK